jgi:hypothetical protein
LFEHKSSVTLQCQRVVRSKSTPFPESDMRSADRKERQLASSATTQRSTQQRVLELMDANQRLSRVVTQRDHDVFALWKRVDAAKAETKALVLVESARAKQAQSSAVQQRRNNDELKKLIVKVEALASLLDTYGELLSGASSSSSSSSSHASSSSNNALRAAKSSERALLAKLATVQEDLSISVSCTNLIKMDWLSLSDPMVELHVLAPDSQLFELHSQTEWKTDNHNPRFSTLLRVQRDSDWSEAEWLSLQLRFSVYDVDSKTVREEDLMGRAVITVSDLLKAHASAAAPAVALGLVHASRPKINNKLQKRKSTVNVGLSTVYWQTATVATAAAAAAIAAVRAAEAAKQQQLSISSTSSSSSSSSLSSAKHVVSITFAVEALHAQLSRLHTLNQLLAQATASAQQPQQQPFSLSAVAAPSDVASSSESKHNVATAAAAAVAAFDADPIFGNTLAAADEFADTSVVTPTTTT